MQVISLHTLLGWNSNQLPLPMEKAVAPHSSTPAWKNPMDGGAWWATVHGVTKSQTWLNNFTFTSHFHALEKEMATHSSVLAWRIPGTGEPRGLPSMGSRRVGHDWRNLAAAAAITNCCHWSAPSWLAKPVFCCVPVIRLLLHGARGVN